MARTSKTVLNNSDKGGIFDLFLTLEEMLCFSSLSDLSGLVIYGLYYVEVGSLYVPSSFYH